MKINVNIGKKGDLKHFSIFSLKFIKLYQRWKAFHYE